MLKKWYSNKFLRKPVFFAISKFFYNNKIKIIKSSSSEIDNIFQEGEVIFKKNPTVDLSEVSNLIQSATSKRQGDQRKHGFLEKKNTP